MQYKKNEAPYTIADLKRDNPSIGFPRNALRNPSIRAKFGIEEIPIEELPPYHIKEIAPDTPEGHKAISGSPELVDGAWQATWTYEPLPYGEARAKAYPAIGDQLDALFKHLNYRRTQGDALVQDLDDVIGEWLSVKAAYPKPE